MTHLALWMLACVVVSAFAPPSDRSGPPAGALRVTIRARALQPGEMAVATIAAPADATSVRIEALREEIAAYRVAPREWQALIGVDLDVAPGAHPLEVTAITPAGTVKHSEELHVLAKRFPTRTLHVDEAFVNPPAAETERIERENQEMRAIWQTPAGERLWRPPFVRPVPGAANSRFGTRSIFNGQPRNPHGGADMLSPAGTPIAAPNAGRVRLARPLYFSGNTVIIDHGLGLFSLLAHMSQIDVREGDEVKAGEIVGLVGATGRVTGPHLHWAIRASGARVDPMSVLALLGSRAN